jgi:hypothetical protein
VLGHLPPSNKPTSLASPRPRSLRLSPSLPSTPASSLSHTHTHYSWSSKLARLLASKREFRRPTSISILVPPTEPQAHTYDAATTPSSADPFYIRYDDDDEKIDTKQPAFSSYRPREWSCSLRTQTCSCRSALLPQPPSQWS